MSYSMALIIEGREIPISVLPARLEVSSPGRNDRAVVIELGEILILRKKRLRSITWRSFFPAHDAPFVTGSMIDPIEAIRAIQSARDAEQPIRLLITGTDLDINTRVGVHAFGYSERSGELGDLYYDITLQEWKIYAARRVILPSEPVEPAREEEPARPANPPTATERTHTVVSGDSLWAIAQRFYGSGARWNEIYQANRAVVGSNPNLIFPGQVLIIP